ncbi:uncharacterized protein LOC127793792 isoform X1 [Diospyros lotus]|uniref:uncharacterized protein LOC127793792 isoform X1 n=1 Tax=Diospyros lotus TaxID=55363 RepID=UPI0022568F64|nr:uncharacterized protein LOC127793792 isoform X1 [Diospyros lotus]
MGRRVDAALEVQRKKLKKHGKKKNPLLKKFFDYLKSDSYMFAPLVSSQPSGSSSPTEPISTFATRDETEKPGGENSKKLLKKVREYLLSDCYMYAPLTDAQQSQGVDSATSSPPCTGPVWRPKRVATAFPIREVPKETKQPTEQTVMLTGKDQRTDRSPVKKTTLVRQTRQETVKHVVHRQCRSSSIPGKGMLETDQRKVTVE